MKKILTLTALACIATNGANASTSICSVVECNGLEIAMTAPTNCATTSTTCYTPVGGSSRYALISCASCPSGETMSVEPVVNACGSFTYNTCSGTGGGSTLPTCPSGCSSRVWKAHSEGYEVKCDISNGLAICAYRCAAGYYGSASGNVSGSIVRGCTLCPSSGGVAGQSAAGTLSVIGCYIPSGTSFSDSTGSGTYTDNCYWSE